MEIRRRARQRTARLSIAVNLAIVAAAVDRYLEPYACAEAHLRATRFPFFCDSWWRVFIGISCYTFDDIELFMMNYCGIIVTH